MIPVEVLSGGADPAAILSDLNNLALNEIWFSLLQYEPAEDARAADASVVYVTAIDQDLNLQDREAIARWEWQLLSIAVQPTCCRSVIFLRMRVCT